MTSFVLIVLCFGLGIWAKKWKRFSHHSVPVINAFVLHLSLPAMATMITAAVIAMEFGLNADVANFMVSATIPLSLLSVPLFNALLRMSI